MRFSLTGVAVIMASILALAVFIIENYRSDTFQEGHSSIIVVLNSSDYDGLRAAMHESRSPVVKELSDRGVGFHRCYPSSPWGPSVVASLLTGLYPSEHGLHLGHAYLSMEAQTLAERLGSCCFRPYAAVGTHSLLELSNVLQGFTFKDQVDPRETITSFLSFYQNVASHRKFCALVEVDLDAFGGPTSLNTVLDILYDGIGREKYLEHGIITLLAPGPNQVDTRKGFDPFGSGMPVVLAGQPLKIAPGKLVLKPISVCRLSDVLWDLCLGQGFHIRDAERNGTAIVEEQAVDYQYTGSGEAHQPPPLFHRALWFDNSPYCYWVRPDKGSLVLDGSGREALPEPEENALMQARYTDFLAGRRSVTDPAIPQHAAVLLNREYAEKLGAPWTRSIFLGRNLHCVEHFRLAEAFQNHGYPALAVAEYNTVLALDNDFPEALFALAEVYALIDLKGAVRYYQKFLDRYGRLLPMAERAAKARKVLEGKAD